MESACSLSSTHRIVLFGRISFPLEVFRGWPAQWHERKFLRLVFVTLVQELYGNRSGEASNRNANKWKTLWRTFFNRQSRLESERNRVLAAPIVQKINSCLQNKFSARHFCNVPAHAHVYDLVIISSGAKKYPAAAFHFHALFHQHLLIGGNYAILHRPRGTRAGRGAGGRILTVITDHARLQPGFR